MEWSCLWGSLARAPVTIPCDIVTAVTFFASPCKAHWVTQKRLSNGPFFITSTEGAYVDGTIGDRYFIQEHPVPHRFQPCFHRGPGLFPGLCPPFQGQAFPRACNGPGAAGVGGRPLRTGSQRPGRTEAAPAFTHGGIQRRKLSAAAQPVRV